MVATKRQVSNGKYFVRTDHARLLAPLEPIVMGVQDAGHKVRRDVCVC